VGLVGIQFLFVLRLFSFESGFSFMVLNKLCMLKCKHLRVRVRAPRAVVMRRRKALTLLPVLPLAVDPIHLLVEMQVLQGAKIKRIGRRTRTRMRGKGTMTRGRRMSNLPLHQRTLGRNIQGRNPRGEGSLDRQLVCLIPKGCKPFYIVNFEILI
jgi:hypothetical protein